MKLKGMNKKGQGEGIGLGTLLAIILGIVALVLIIMGMTTGFGFFTDLFGKADVDVSLISQKCNSLITLSTGTDYCSNRIEIAKNSYVNCPYANSTLGASIEGAPDCPKEFGEKAICNKLKLEQGDKFDAEKIMVNDKSCDDWGVK